MKGDKTFPHKEQEKMKLKISTFENFARKHGYENGTELLNAMGSSERAYKHFRHGGSIGSDLVAEFFNRYGEEAFSFIDFGDDTPRGFKSKYVQIGNKLY